MPNPPPMGRHAEPRAGRASAAAFAQNAAPSDDGLIKVRSAYPMDETIQRMRKDIADKGIMFFQAVDQSGLAAKAGIHAAPSTLLEFGNPPLGAQFLTSNPYAGLDWPVRVLVLQDEAGIVWAAYTDFGWIARRHRIGDRQQQFAMAAGRGRVDHLDDQGGALKSRTLAAADTQETNHAHTPTTPSSSARARPALLAARLAGAGLKTALIEREHLGGTCVNDRLHPDEDAAGQRPRRAHGAPRRPTMACTSTAPVSVDMAAVKARKDRIVGAVGRQRDERGCSGIDEADSSRGHARFTAPMREVSGRHGTQQLEAPRIFINVGGRALVPDYARHRRGAGT